MKIAIIGAGAAGCFAAANIPYLPGREVVVFEKTGKALQKVKVSGGGRCNTTHHQFDPEVFAAQYPRGRQLLRKTLHRFGARETINWFKVRGVALKHESDGRMFPVTDRSETIIDCLWQAMMKEQVAVRYHKGVQTIEPDFGKLRLIFTDGTDYLADKVLVACGGYLKPEQYRWLQALGHTVQTPVPSLFTFNLPGHPITALMGISVPMVSIKVAGTKITEKGPLLITHWGLSGPAVLRTSAWGARVLSEKGYEFLAMVNWLEDTTEAELREQLVQIRKERGGQLVVQKNPFDLPRRLWEFLSSQAGITGSTRWAELPAGPQQKLIELLLRHPFSVKGKTTFKEEFVTCGGVPLSEVDPQTMESRKQPGVYFAGEILDVDGITGGFNFQHAWSSGYIAAQALAASLAAT